MSGCSYTGPRKELGIPKAQDETRTESARDLPVKKIGLALVRDDHVLLVRRSGDPLLILPGGKPTGDENDVRALSREIEEELSCELDTATLRYVRDFEDQLADDPSRRVQIRLYAGDIIGRPKASSEIGELVWHPLRDLKEPTLAPSLRNQILTELGKSRPGNRK